MAVLSYIHVGYVVLFIILWLIEGYSHSAVTIKKVFPGGMSLMNSYYPASKRGKVMGLWGSAASAGNLLGIVLYTSLEEELHLPWTETLALSGALIIFIAVAIIIVFRETFTSSHLLKNPSNPSQPKRAGFFEAWKVKGLLIYTMAYTCCKFMNYAWMMWLPYYLETAVGVKHFYIGLSTAGYEIGSVLGTFGGGWVSDLIHSRVKTVQVMLSFVCPLSLLLWFTDKDSPLVIVLICFGLGVSVAGVCYLVNSCAAADISASGTQIGAISGLMDGVASLITGGGIFFIGFVQRFSWAWVFLAICVADLTAIGLVGFVSVKKAKG
jgi:sugar phosphate permease